MTGTKRNIQKSILQNVSHFSSSFQKYNFYVKTVGQTQTQAYITLTLNQPKIYLIGFTLVKVQSFSLLAFA